MKRPDQRLNPRVFNLFDPTTIPCFHLSAFNKACISLVMMRMKISRLELINTYRTWGDDVLNEPITMDHSIQRI